MVLQEVSLSDLQGVDGGGWNNIVGAVGGFVAGGVSGGLNTGSVIGAAIGAVGGAVYGYQHPDESSQSNSNAGRDWA